MTTATASISTTHTSAHCDRPAHPARRPDTECRSRATEFLTALIGAAPVDLTWDDVHHLQGHAHHEGHELILVAARDETHEPVVLTVEDWGQVRRDTSNRRALLEERAISDRRRLEAAFGR